MRRSKAAATGSLGSVAVNRPLTISRWWTIPTPASSTAVRAASARVVASGRATKTTVVWSGSARAAIAAR